MIPSPLGVKELIPLLFGIFVLILINSCENDINTAISADIKTLAQSTTVITVSYDKVDKESHLPWNASHLGGINPRYGKIFYQNTSISVDGDKIVGANISIDMNTLLVENMPEDESIDLRDHLKSSDFFGVETLPTSEFELTQLTQINGVYNSKVSGKLTILGIKKDITFNANIQVDKSEIYITTENFNLDRSNWGLIYNA